MRAIAEEENRNIVLFTDIPWHGPSPSEWVVIQPKKNPDDGGNFLDIVYPDEVVSLVLSAIIETDQTLLDISAEKSGLVSQAIPQIEPDRYLDEPTWPALLRTEAKIMAGLLSDPTACCVGVLNGVSPIWNHMKDSFEADGFFDVSDRVSATIISGYNGVLAEAPRVLIPLSDQVIESGIVYAMDDLIDSGKSIASLYQEIARMRGHIVDQNIVSELSSIKNKPFSDFKPVFERLVKLLHTENIVVSAAYYKNETFLQCMDEYIGQLNMSKNGDAWSIAQQKMIDGVLVFGQHDWLMGRGLDTGIQGDELTTRIRNALDSEGSSLDETGESLMKYIEHSLIRVGSFVDGLVVLNNNDIHGLTDLVANTFLPYVRKFVRNN